MIYSQEVENMCPVAQGVHHGCAPIPEEAKWVQAKEVKDISGLTHGIGWCAPQQGACKLTLNVKEGIIQEAEKKAASIIANANKEAEDSWNQFQRKADELIRARAELSALVKRN